MDPAQNNVTPIKPFYDQKTIADSVVKSDNLNYNVGIGCHRVEHVIANPIGAAFGAVLGVGLAAVFTAVLLGGIDYAIAPFGGALKNMFRKSRDERPRV